ncbi:MAG: hypothetical protein GXY52_04365 [Chloroflexi bacterium]|nr:hypothetical protein [Chloroflexota bacterium]
MATHVINPTRFHYTYGVQSEGIPIRSGDTIVAKTRDAFGMDETGAPMPEAYMQQVAGVQLRHSNPTVGPFIIEGAEPGDLLRIEIRSITLNRSWGRSRQGPNFGSLTGEGPGKRMLYNPPVPEIWYDWQLDLERQVGTLQLPGSHLQMAEVPLAPFIGSIGVAPAYGHVEMTLTAGEYGGNMDCPDVAAGTVLELPVWTRGAYLQFGDIHALQGDGELNGTAVEVTAEVTLNIELVKGRGAAWPRLISPGDIMVLASTRPLDDCVRIGQIELLEWLVTEYGFAREEAWQLNAQVGSMRIGNMVDPTYTVVSRFPRRYLPR